jgi:hypothetical protein
MRPMRESPVLRAARALPAPSRWGLIVTLALLAAAPAWRFYGWWWDFWNGPGTFYERWLPVFR